MKKILFVCSGNTCRSPMAEGYFNYLVKNQNMENNWRADSAGLHAFEGSPANERSRIVCFEDEIDLSDHSSRPLSAKTVEDASLVLTMTKEQKSELLEHFPGARDKTHTLKEFANQRGDITDPIGLGENAYQSTYEEIKKLVTTVLERITHDETCTRK